MSGIEHPIDQNDHSIIQIKAVAKRNGLTTFLIGLMILALAILLLNVLPQAVYLIGVFALSGSIVTMLIGWFKMREPQHSIELSKTHIHYRHRHGKWDLKWANVQRIDIPRVSSGFEQKSLGMVGIKIKSYEPLLQSISPRLATNLLLEQRPLLLLNAGCATGGCYNNDLIEDDRFKTQSGKLITGIPAMLANRMTKLRASLGYDLYISVAELDRSADEFVALLTQCQMQITKDQ
jgi:hypothetical protein